MESQPSSKRGIIVLVVVLGISAVLGGLIGPTVRATAAGNKENDVQDSVCLLYTSSPFSSDSKAPDPVLVVGVVGHVRHWGLAGDDQAQVRAQLYYNLSLIHI